MRSTRLVRTSRLAIASVALSGAIVALLTGCNAGNSTSPVVPGGSAAAISAGGSTASASPSASGSSSPAVGATTTPAGTNSGGATASPAAVSGGSSNSGASSGSPVNVPECFNEAASGTPGATDISAIGVINGTTFQLAQNSSSDARATWTKVTFGPIAQSSATPFPIVELSPVPTDTPTDQPTPSGTQTTTIYYGTYTVTNPNGSVDTKGCAVASLLGSNQQASTDVMAYAEGFVVPPVGETDTTVSTGNITAYTVNNIGSGNATGTFTLDNGQTGTVTLNQTYTFTEPVYNYAKYRHILGKLKR